MEEVDDIEDAPEDVQPILRWLNDWIDEFGAQKANWKDNGDTVDVTFTFDKERFQDGE